MRVRLDPRIPVLVVLLMGLGVLLVASASERMSRSYDAIQVRWIGVALCAAAVVALVPYGRLVERAYLFYGAVIVLLAGTLVAARPINGSRRWLDVFGFTFQASEYMKPAFVLVLARHLRFRRDLDRPRALLRPALLALVPMVLITLEPDLSTSLLFPAVAFALVYLQGARRRHLLAFVLTVLVVGVASFKLVLRPYQQERILSTYMGSRLSPDEKARSAYQLTQALIAVGSGGAFGRGYGQGEQNLAGKVPERHNDFVFSVLGEEFGFFGSALVLLLYLVLILAALGVARRTREPAGRLIAAGAAVFLLCQTLVNVGVNLGLVPTTGVTLPFLSYGGASMLTWTVMMGLVLNVSMRRPPVLAREEAGPTGA